MIRPGPRGAGTGSVTSASGTAEAYATYAAGGHGKAPGLDPDSGGRDEHVRRPPTRARTCTGSARPTQSGSVLNRLASASGEASIGAYATPLTASWTWFCQDSPAKPGPVRSMWSRRNTPAGYGARSPSERRRASWTPTCMPGASGRARTAGTPARAAGQDRDHRRGCGRSAPKARCQLRAADTRQAAAAACAAGSCSCTALAACRAGSSRLPDAPWHHTTTVSPTALRQRTSPHGRHGRRKRRDVFDCGAISCRLAISGRADERLRRRAAPHTLRRGRAGPARNRLHRNVHA